MPQELSLSRGCLARSTNKQFVVVGGQRSPVRAGVRRTSVFRDWLVGEVCTARPTPTIPLEQQLLLLLIRESFVFHGAAASGVTNRLSAPEHNLGYQREGCRAEEVDASRVQRRLSFGFTTLHATVSVLLTRLTPCV
jgi:hypothetical protein